MELVRKQAIETFGNGITGGETFEKNLDKLISIMNKLTAEDVKLDRDLLLPRTRFSAPVTYIDILEHPCLTINMFVLRPGSKLPLHDHPHMYGICKVIQGKVRIRSFTLDPDQKFNKDKRVTAAIESEMIVTDSCESVLLTPRKGNIHEIRAHDGGAAFVDILAPPYHSNNDGLGPRTCHYFIEASNSKKSTSVEFFKVERVPEYWTDFAPYVGP